MATQIRGNTQIKSGTIENAQIASAAAIAVSKLEALTASGIVFTDGSGFLTSTMLMSGDISWNGSGFDISSGAIVDADINSSAAIATSKLADGSLFLKSDGSVAMSMGDLNLGSNKIINLADGSSSGDAVNKGQLDAAVTALSNNLDYKNPVKLLATSNLDLSGAETIDGVSTTNGDRVGVVGQTDATQNGIYVVATGSWSRATDADTETELTPGAFFLVTAGTNYVGTGWVLTSTVSMLGMDNVDFLQVQAPNTTLGGAGLTKTGVTIDVVSGNGGIVVNTNDITLTVDATADSLSVGSGGVKLKDGTSAQVYVADGSGVFKRVSVSGDVTISNAGVTAIGSGVIVNADINASAAIALSKLASGASAQVPVCNGSGVPTYVDITGDVTISNAGVTAIASGVIVNADINASAAIALSKLASGTSAQIVVCNGSGVPTYVTMSGDATIDNTGAVTVTSTGLVASNFVFNEAPNETPDGMTTDFTVDNTPTTGKLTVYLNGLLLKPTTDYTVSGATISFVSAPETGDLILCNYLK